MPTYDICCIASARVSNKHLINLISKVAGDVLKRGGMVRKIEHYGVKPLAYSIRSHSHKHEIGRYFRMFAQVSPLSLEDIRHRLRVDEGIIRFRAFTVNNNDIFDKPTSKWQHKPKISEAHYDALKRSTNIDYYIARTLLKTGKMTVDEIKALGTHSPIIEPYISSSEAAAASRAFGTVHNDEDDVFAEEVAEQMSGVNAAQIEQIYDDDEEDVFATKSK